MFSRMQQWHAEPLLLRYTHTAAEFFSLQSEHFSVWMRQSLWGKVAAAPTMSSVWKSKEKGRCLENDYQEEKEIVWNGFFLSLTAHVHDFGLWTTTWLFKQCCFCCVFARLVYTSIKKKWLLRHDAFTSFFASQSWYTQPSSLVSAKSSAELHHLMMMLPKPHITRAAYTTSTTGLVTNSILFCRLFTIKDRYAKVRFQQTHNQGLQQLFLTVSWDLCA